MTDSDEATRLEAQLAPVLINKTRSGYSWKIYGGVPGGLERIKKAIDEALDGDLHIRQRLAEAGLPVDIELK